MNIGADEANPDLDLPCDPCDEGHYSNAIGITDNNNNNEDHHAGDKGDGEDEDDAMDGPTVEAYIELVKRTCRYYFAGCCPMHILTHIYSAQSLS